MAAHAKTTTAKTSIVSTLLRSYGQMITSQPLGAALFTLVAAIVLGVGAWLLIKLLIASVPYLISAAVVVFLFRFSKDTFLGKR